jgi:hypothetical protein
MRVLMQRKDALPVLFLYLRSTNAFKSAYVVIIGGARSTVCAKFTNFTVRAEKERLTFCDMLVTICSRTACTLVINGGRNMDMRMK